MSAPKLNGYQVRTERTKAQLLAAAEEVFVRSGFEGAQMDEIAKAAGRSKGAIYAHYQSKDDLFLALYEHRSQIAFDRIFNSVKKSASREEAFQAFKKAIVDVSNDRTWLLLTIEAKLYAIRHPELREKWLRSESANAKRYSSDEGWEATGKLIFGEITKAQRSEIEAKAVAIAPILHGLALEAEFHPKILSKKRISSITNDLFEVLLRTSGPPASS